MAVGLEVVTPTGDEAGTDPKSGVFETMEDIIEDGVKGETGF